MHRSAISMHHDSDASHKGHTYVTYPGHVMRLHQSRTQIIIIIISIHHKEHMNELIKG